MINQRTYKIRKFANGKARSGQAFINYSLTIPSHIAERLPEDMQFSCELTDAGLLFRPVQPQIEVELPPWAAQEDGKEETKPARKRRQKPSGATRKKPQAKRPRKKPQAGPAPPEAEPADTPESDHDIESDNGVGEPQAAEATAEVTA
jgi:hypothetical protein